MEKMREGLQRRARRMQENLQQSVGLSEKKDELQSVNHIEQRNQKMISAVKNTRQHLQNCIRAGSKDEATDKRKRRLDEYGLWQQLLVDSKELENVFPRTEPSLLVDVLRMYGDAVGAILEEKALTDQNIEKSVLAAFTKYVDEEKSLTKAKEKLARTVVDVEVSRKRRLNNHDESKAQEIQDEYDALQLKLENYKDSIFTDIFTLLSKETEIAGIYKELIAAQLEYHRVASEKLENIMPEIDRKIASYPRRPVFGCHLEDHLRYSNRSIALVLEVCCSALKCYGFQEKGLFRISGNSNRIRRMKAAFDAHQISGTSLELSEYINDPHSICSVLKCYLRELPEPLMTHTLHADWKKLANKEPDTRKETILRLLPLLPEANRLNLAYLIRFLQLMLSYEEHTKMGVGNLAIVFGPNLINAGSDEEADNLLGSKLIETFITNVDLFFPNDHFDFTSPLVDTNVQQRILPVSSAAGDEKVLMRPTAAPRSSFSQIPNNNCNKEAIQQRITTSTTPTQRQRPKWPAPPPPTNTNVNSAACSTDVDDLSLSLEHLNNFVCKSPSIASNDSMAEYGCTFTDITQMMTRSYQEPSRPVRPPPPRTSRRSSSPEGTSVNIFGCTRKLVGEHHAELLNLPIDSSTNNRTVVHLETDSSQRNQRDNAGGSLSKPPLPNKPKTATDFGKPNEITKL